MGNEAKIRLSPADREKLEKLIRARRTPQKVVWRARIVLLSADGLGTMKIMRRSGVSKPTVWRWQRRFAEAGVDRLLRDAIAKQADWPRTNTFTPRYCLDGTRAARGETLLRLLKSLSKETRGEGAKTAGGEASLRASWPE